MKIRKVAVVAMVAALAVPMVAAPAGAVRPSGTCGFGFEVKTIAETLPLVSAGSPNPPEVLLASLQGLDVNDDDLVYVKDLPDTPGSPSYVRNVVDNTAAAGR